MILTTLKLGCACECSQAGSTGERNRERDTGYPSLYKRQSRMRREGREKERPRFIPNSNSTFIIIHTNQACLHSYTASASWKLQVMPDWFKLQTRGERLKSNTSSQRDMAWYPEDACDRIASMRHPSISSVQGCTSWTRTCESFIQYSDDKDYRIRKFWL